MRAPLNQHRATRMAAACAILFGLTAPLAAPAVAAPKPPPSSDAPKPPGGGGGGAPKLPSVPVIDKEWGPQPPPGDPGPPPAAEKPAPPKGGYQQKTECIQSNAELPLDRKPWPQDQLNLNKAHQFAKGGGNTVAVIDTGVSQHNYLQGRLLPGGDYVKPEENGTHDCDGHGTEVAGIIAANSNGAVGFNGMAPESNILSIRTTSTLFESKGADANGQHQHPGTIESLAKAVMWSLKRSEDLNTNLVAINISLTSCIANPGALDQNYRQLQSAVDAATKQGVVVVAAAGNKAKEQGQGCTQNNDSADPGKIKAIPIPPWLGKNVLSVGSVNQQGAASDFSIAGPWVGVAAPGENLYSLDPASPDKLVNQSVEINPDADSGGGQNTQPSPLQGTSFAAPYVSGLVSLLRDKYPKGKYSAQDIIRRIELTAQHPGGADGRNNRVGYGLINPVAALTANIPAESGGKPDKAISIPAKLPPPYDANDTATTVAIAGGLGALALLILTAFVMHTVKRSRERRGR